MRNMQYILVLWSWEERAAKKAPSLKELRGVIDSSDADASCNCWHWGPKKGNATVKEYQPAVTKTKNILRTTSVRLWTQYSTSSSLNYTWNGSHIIRNECPLLNRTQTNRSVWAVTNEVFKSRFIILEAVLLLNLRLLYADFSHKKDAIFFSRCRKRKKERRENNGIAACWRITP